MYTAIAQTRNINIEASLLLLDTTSTKKRYYQYNRFYLIATNNLMIYTKVPLLYPAYMTRVFLTNAPRQDDPGPSCRNTLRWSDNLTVYWYISSLPKWIFGRDTYCPKPETLFEPRPLRTTSIDQVRSYAEIPERGIQEPYDEFYFLWINPENTSTIADIAALVRYQYSEDFSNHTPSERSNSVWNTQYPDTNQRWSQPFMIPEVWRRN